MPNLRIAIVTGVATCALLLCAAPSTQSTSAFSLDLSPLHRVSTQPTLQAGTYASAAPQGSHRHPQNLAHHHTL